MAKNKKLTEKEVRHIGRLANLPLSEEEVKKFQTQLSETLEYIETLSTIIDENIPPTSQVTELSNVVRNDETAPSLSQEEAIRNASQTHNGFIKVKAIFNEES